MYEEVHIGLCKDDNCLVCTYSTLCVCVCVWYFILLPWYFRDCRVPEFSG